MCNLKYFFILNFIGLFITNGFCGSGVYQLDWEKPTEYLEYHSCGCGDSCWVAELKIKKTKKLKIGLMCDCEKLFVYYKNKKQKSLLDNNCDKFNTNELNGKSKAITSKMKDLILKK
jgi:hypothetical protein